MKAYVFWYLSSPNAKTEYVYVIAVSYRQAKYFWLNYLKYSLGYAFDYDLDPCNEIDKSHFSKHHDVGDILGQYAIL